MFMKIKVEFFAYLANYSPTGEKRITLILNDGVTLRDLCHMLKIPRKVEKICLINGAFHPEDKELEQGDIVSLYPMVDGG